MPLIEHGFYGLADTDYDASVFLEGLYSNNRQGVALPYKQHVMIGLRLDSNNESSSNVMFSLINDIDNNDRTIYINSQHRFTNKLSAEVDVWYFDIRKKSSDLLYLKQEGYIQLGIKYYL